MASQARHILKPALLAVAVLAGHFFSQPAGAAEATQAPPMTATPAINGEVAALPVIAARARGGSGGGSHSGGHRNHGFRGHNFHGHNFHGHNFHGHNFHGHNFHGHQGGYRRPYYRGGLIIGPAVGFSAFSPYNDCQPVRVKERRCWIDHDGGKSCGSRWVLRRLCD